MKTKSKLALAFVLMLLGFASLKAQDKYEFMTINYEAGAFGMGINISIDGKQFLFESVKLEKPDKSFLNTNPLLTKVKEYQDKGWEIINLSTTTIEKGYIHSAYLRKKKADK